MINSTAKQNLVLNTFATFTGYCALTSGAKAIFGTSSLSSFTSRIRNSEQSNLTKLLFGHETLTSRVSNLGKSIAYMACSVLLLDISNNILETDKENQKRTQEIFQIINAPLSGNSSIGSCSNPVLFGYALGLCETTGHLASNFTESSKGIANLASQKKQLATANQMTKELTNQLNHCTTELTNQRTHLETLNQTNVELEHKFNNSTAQLRALNQRIVDQRSRLDNCNTELTNQTVKWANTNQTVTNLTNQLDHYKTQLTNQKAQLAILNQSQLELKGKFNNCITELTHANQTNLDKEAQITNANLTVTNLKNQLGNCTVQWAQANQTVINKENKLGNCTDQLETVNQKIASLFNQTNVLNQQSNNTKIV